MRLKIKQVNNIAQALRLCCFAVILWGQMLPHGRALAEEFVSEFDGPEPSWKVASLAREARIVIHERRRGIGKAGGAEFVRAQSNIDGPAIRLEHPVPAATVLDELEVSVWFKSNHEGFVLEMIVTLPDVFDPVTKVPLKMMISGDKYTTPNQWQQLRCRAADKAVNNQLRLLRANRQQAVNPRMMFVERVAIDGQLVPGPTDLFFDKLVLSPLVRFRTNQSASDVETIQLSNQSSVRNSANDIRNAPKIEFRGHRLFVDEKSMFPRIVIDHGERPQVFASAGMNVVWVKNFENSAATEALRAAGLMVTATPPFAKGAEGEPLDSADASLLPFQSNTSSVLFWMLGSRMTPEGRPRMDSWTNQVRNADRQFVKRPIAADVIENERLCSRLVDLLGISRHVINSSCSLVDYRDWLIQRRDQAWPDTFCWTWIQTEPAPLLTEMAHSLDSPPMLEPEQIRLQVYAALAAGVRGLGFWSTTPLDHDSPAARERLLTLTQLSLELDLFEPWITVGGTPQLVSFKVEAPRTELSASDKKTVRATAAAATRKGANATTAQLELQAAMIRLEQGALLLPMWLDDKSQYVPGQMFARNVTVTVPGGGETAAAWEMTTTGQLRNLERLPVAGGVQIKLPRFDQTAAIIITSQRATVDELNQKIAAIQEQSARVSVELAKLKLERILKTDQKLQNLGVGRTSAPTWLGEAKLKLDKADADLRKLQYAEAGQSAADAMQLGRHLQRVYWEHAVNQLPNITASPWVLSFQSLPEHWKLTRRFESLGPQNSQDNLLPSGEFEDYDTLSAEHWKFESANQENVQSLADLYHVARTGRYSLRLSAIPTSAEAVSKSISKPLVTVTSPGISVHAGQVVLITGWVKIPSPLLGSVDGALIYESLLGKPGAVRLKEVQDWKQFELVRLVPQSQELTVTIALQGLGAVQVDDLRITEFDLGSDLPTSIPVKSEVSPTRFSPLDFRQLNPIPKRRDNR